jgi:hypothetical protein
MLVIKRWLFMPENIDPSLPSALIEPAIRVSTYHQKGLKIYDNNPLELIIADIIDHAQILQEYGLDRSDAVIGLHRAAQQLAQEVQNFLIS